LVELLVVVGIIGLLMGILLPTVSRARKSAAMVKCAGALRQIGAAYTAYANDNRGFWPAVKYIPAGGVNYQMRGFDYTFSRPAYWFDFLATYVAQDKLGNATATATDSQQARKGVLWGCPAWQPYVANNPNAIGSAGGVENVQTGYGMNRWLTFSADNPKVGVAFPTADDGIIVDGLSPRQTGKFFRMSQIENPGERCLCADSRFWCAESNPVPPASSYPPAVVPQSTYNDNNTYTPGVSGQTMIDVYRHGTPPTGNSGATGAFSPWGGSIAYNILYCDGHVGETTDAKQAYLSIRQRFPN
jgi:prepilin-type processing-associated H-X9-DG protein